MKSNILLSSTVHKKNAYSMLAYTTNMVTNVMMNIHLLKMRNV